MDMEKLWAFPRALMLTGFAVILRDRYPPFARPLSPAVSDRYPPSSAAKRPHRDRYPPRDQGLSGQVRLSLVRN